MLQTIIQFSAQHYMLAIILGIVIALPSIMAIVVAFPVDNHTPSAIASASPLGYVANVFRTWGFWRIFKCALVPMAGIAITLLGALAPTIQAASRQPPNIYANALSVGNDGDWDCANTTTKEPGKPPVVVATRCWSGVRIELEAPK